MTLKATMFRIKTVKTNKMNRVEQFNLFLHRNSVYYHNEEISLKENTKHITKFLMLLKNANYRKKILKHVERNIYKCTEVFNFEQREKKINKLNRTQLIKQQACKLQKQPYKSVFKKRCSENRQQIYRRKPVLKCDFNKVAKQPLGGCF